MTTGGIAVNGHRLKPTKVQAWGLKCRRSQHYVEMETGWPAGVINPYGRVVICGHGEFRERGCVHSRPKKPALGARTTGPWIVRGGLALKRRQGERAGSTTTNRKSGVSRITAAPGATPAFFAELDQFARRLSRLRGDPPPGIARWV